MNDAWIEFTLTRDQINALWTRIANLRTEVTRLTAANAQLQAENQRLREIVAPLIAAGKQATAAGWQTGDGWLYINKNSYPMSIQDARFIIVSRAVADALAAEQDELVERLR